MGRFLARVRKDRVDKLVVIVDIGICLILLFTRKDCEVCGLIACIDGKFVESVLQAFKYLVDVKYHVGAFSYSNTVGGEGYTGLAVPTAILGKRRILQQVGAIGAIDHAVGNSLRQ